MAAGGSASPGDAQRGPTQGPPLAPSLSQVLSPLPQTPPWTRDPQSQAQAGGSAAQVDRALTLQPVRPRVELPSHTRGHETPFPASPARDPCPGGDTGRAWPPSTKVGAAKCLGKAPGYSRAFPAISLRNATRRLSGMWLPTRQVPSTNGPSIFSSVGLYVAAGWLFLPPAAAWGCCHSSQPLGGQGHVTRATQHKQH